MRISDWSSDVCSSDLAKLGRRHAAEAVVIFAPHRGGQHRALGSNRIRPGPDQRQTEFGIGEPTAFVALDIDRTAKVVALQQAVRPVAGANGKPRIATPQFEQGTFGADLVGPALVGIAEPNGRCRNSGSKSDNVGLDRKSK